MGTQLNHAMRQANVFPSMVVQMVSIGEESGALDAMLDKSATYYEEMVDNAVDGLTSMIEPIIMAFLGIVVGGMMIAMYLPIFQMGGAMSGCWTSFTFCTSSTQSLRRASISLSVY